MDGDLCYLSASQALGRFRERRLSPVELIRAVQARAAALEPAVNALVETYWDEALTEARAAEDRYRPGAAASPRPLEGVPFVVKDDTGVQGRRWASCSRLYEDQIADFTNPTIARLLEAGAIMIGRSACSELAWSWACRSPLHGTTRNPWNLSVTSGGSSGGSAAALAAGMTTLATGTDSAGSVRMPSALCGVVGFKPPRGRNPEAWEYLGDQYNEVGSMARAVEDVVRMQNAVAGPHPDDPTALRPKLTIPWPLPDLKGMRIAYSLDLGFLEIAPDVRRNTLAMVDRLRGLGAAVEEVAVPWVKSALDAADHNTDFFLAEELKEVISGEKAHLVSDEIRAVLDEVRHVTRTDFMASIVEARTAWLAFAPVLEAHEAFLCPTVATTEIPADWRLGDPVMINGRPAERFVTTLLFNMFHTCPALTVPSGRSANGVPTGLQIAGRPFDDETVFRIAAALEKEAPWYADDERRPASRGDRTSNGTLA